MAPPPFFHCWCRFFANRPLFAHQLGTGPHSSSIHSGHLSAHEMDRRRALHFFYGPESLYRRSATGGSPTLWVELGLAQFMETAAYFQDSSIWITCVLVSPLPVVVILTRLFVTPMLIIALCRWISIFYFVFLPSTAIAALLSECSAPPSVCAGAPPTPNIELTESKIT